MSNISTTAFGNGLQQHNLTAATIDYLNHNGTTAMGTYPGVTTSESGLILDKQSAATYYATAPNPTAFYSTQFVAQTPGTILITNNFGPDESSTISGVNNNFSNSSIRIVTHNNNNNTNHANNNNNDACGNKLASLEQVDFNLNSDKQPHQFHNLHHLHHQPPPQPPSTTMPTMALQLTPSSSPPNPVIKMPNSLVTTGLSSGPQTSTSTVVLDRINICINNHYGDAIPTAASAKMQSGALHSPIIPPIVSQKTTIIDTCAPMIKQIDACDMLDIHIDEPDSTTSTHCHSELMPMEQDTPILQLETEEQEVEMEKCVSFEDIAVQSFEIGEDALVKRRDGRYYLGTIVNKHRQQYLMQFDDKTDYWSNVDELTKLSEAIRSKETPRCLTCKLDNDQDVVETCDRCGRGYHRKCTDEVTPDSGRWMCKRCAKPMKYSTEDQSIKKSVNHPKTKKAMKLPYKLDALTWDDKHRVNFEHIYCYCGKSGQFDNKMVQCCKCKQWFHVDCMQSESLQSMLRGDVFYLFGCSLCNNGKEFLRRIEMEWHELVHLLLYNISIMKNFQKYHHLHKEIYPFALENRESLQLSKSKLDLTDMEFKDVILKTLQNNPKLFICGKEIKKEHAVWSLRAIKPPQGPSFDIHKDIVLCNQFIKEKLNINILPYNENEQMEVDFEDVDEEGEKTQNDEPAREPIDNDPSSPSKSKMKLKRKLDDDDDDKFTSDDEIPIKQILEQVKSESSNMQDLSDPLTELLDQILPKEDPPPTATQKPTEEKEKKEKKDIKEECSAVVKPQEQKNSRKRKAFTLSRGYKDSEKSNDLPRNICDSSSDENSSSSRGTLDLIIPPPKNFLGLNNPFRMVTPKKSENTATNTSAVTSKNNSGYTKKSVSFGSNSIFKSTLDLNSKIAALKSCGLFPNISNSDIAKAAGQPRLVRTIKRRLSAKDIMIGPNQEVRRRRTRPLSSNVEVISTTTINQIPSSYFPIRAPIPESTNPTMNSKSTTPISQSSTSPNNTSSSLDSVSLVTVANHGRRLRKRPEKTSPQNSRRNSISSSSSSNSYTGSSVPPPATQSQNAVPLSDLKLSVNKYFGAANRIENGEKFTIRAKRVLTNGQIQYLIEWET